jgi:hypothetical protein
MKLWGIVLSLTLLSVSAVLAGEAPPRHGWSAHPSFDAFVSADDLNEAVPDALPGLAEPSPALRLASALDVAWDGESGRFQTSAFALTRSPFSKNDRSYFAAGRLHAVRTLGPAFRLALDDSARWQRDDRPAVTDFQRNEVIASLDWRPRGRVGLGLRLSDRRRSLPRLEELGFARQSVALATRVSLGQRLVGEAVAAWQHYSARTAKGQRLLFSAEVARFGSRGVISARFSWFEPHEDSWVDGLLGSPSPAAFPLEGPVGGVGTRNYLDEDLALGRATSWEAVDATGSTDADLTGEPALFDPLESESDEWDFGRRKQVLAAFVSRRFGESWFVSAVARYQHKRGPNLLLDGPSGAVVEDDRVAVRLSIRRRLGARLSLLVQGCHLQAWADRPALRFSRNLAALGLELRY